MIKENKQEESDVMKNFIFAVIPFVIIGIYIAIIAANSKKTKESRISEEMCLSIGMIVGEAIGSYIKK